MIDTARLILRPWREEDRAPFLAMCRSPMVMEHLGGPVSERDLDESIARVRACQERYGHCFWAVERREDGAFLGFCGLKIGNVDPIDGEVEIGWRLREDAWGQGYAREAAEASLQWGWTHLDAKWIVAITVPGNIASWGLMKRLGMIPAPDMNFGHPAFSEGHLLYRHITYTIARPAV